MRQQTERSALSGIRVLDLSQGIAGPFCARLLADFGAEVLKLEPPQGDWTRAVGPFPADKPDPERSGLFLCLNANKRGGMLDPLAARDRDLLLDLAATADVIVESHAPAARLSCGYSDLARANPALVLTSVTAFGQTGPYRDYPASDLTITAMSGLLFATGEPGREPLAGAGPRSSYIAGYMAYIATLAALRARKFAGRGQHVDVSAFESTIAILENFTTMNAYNGDDWQRQGNRRGHVHPASVYPCGDGYVELFLLAEDQWRGLCKMIGREDLLADPRYALNADRVRRPDDIDAVLIPWFLQRSKAEIEKMAQNNRIPIAMVADASDLMRSPHLAARAFWIEAAHPVAGTLTYPGMPFKLPASPGCLRFAAPCLDTHSSAIRDAWTGDGSASMPGAPAENAPPAQPRPRPLAGIRILDLTSAWAGPICTRILAYLGAQVIKIEGPGRPDISRGRLPPKGFTERYPNREYGARPWNRNAYFNTLNQGKYDCILDLRHPRGLELAKRLVAISDAVAENFSARVMVRLGLGYPVLKQLNPKVLLLSMPGYGLTGPQRDWVAWGPTVEADAGMCHLIGYRDGPPLSTGMNFNDPLSGFAGCAALLTALAHLEAGGEAQHIDLSHQEAAIGLLGETLMDFVMNKRLGGRSGNRHRVWAPQGCYRCAGDDRWLALTVANDEQWQALCRCLERLDWERDPELAAAAGRRLRHDELDLEIAAWTRARDRDAAWKILIEAGIPAGPVYTATDLNRDPHLAARGFYTELDHPDCGRYPYPGFGFKLTETPGRIDWISPPFAEHNEYVFKELLGLADHEIAQLYDLGITAREPRF